jgi:uncharacterized protein YqjF (DUF2071 family)
LTSWLIERYHLFARDRKGVLLVGSFRHAPWRIFPVTLNICHVRAAPFPDTVYTAPPALAHFSPGLQGQFGTFQTVRDFRQD